MVNKYERYIDNRVIQACIRPQLPKWCGPTTISEIITIFTKKTICPHEIAKIMQWPHENIIKGMGTSAVLSGIRKVSNGKIKTEIININIDKEQLWALIKNAIMRKKEILYLHEKGHHVLIAGFIEEPIITVESFKNGVDCSNSIPTQTTNRSGALSPRFHPKDSLNQSNPWYSTNRILINAEHNIKDPEMRGLGSLLKERNYEEVYEELKNNQGRLHIVRVFL